MRVATGLQERKINYLLIMLIINADDWGRNKTVTDNTVRCFLSGRVTSASAMVFMADSERALRLAQDHGLDTGLHLNFTLAFDGHARFAKLVSSQQRIASFLRMSKYCSLLYNPSLRNDFEYVYKCQYEEYMRLCHKEPTHIDGHHHMHLCTNMLVNRLIPEGTKVRRSFSGFLNKKSLLNRSYRNIVDWILVRRYKCADMFFSITPPQDIERLQRIISLSRSKNVELMVHPEREDDISCLLSDKFSQMLAEIRRGSYALVC